MISLNPITLGYVVCDKVLSTAFPEKGKLVKINNKPIIYKRM